MKIAVALSGGIDSTSALLRLHDEGHDLIGITMKAYSKEHSKCALLKDGIEDAKLICEKIGIKHYLINTENEFKEKVISYFIDEYLNGRTPNACLVCNELVKFKTLVDFANSLGYPYFATGHYAIVEKDKNGKVSLKKGLDAKKDQSYFISRLSSKVLANCIFPLGTTTKKENIELLRKRNLISISEKKESQEMCFVSHDNYKDFIKSNVDTKIQKGNMLNEDNEIIASHEGIPFYTIGQRKGLNVALGKPAFVRDIDPKTKNITIGDKPLSSSLVMSSINWLIEDLDKSLPFNVKVRYMHSGEEAFIEDTTKSSKIRINFTKPVLAITKGQGAVGYRENKVAFSGIIEEVG